jgi:hypothetical protein
VTKKIIFPSFLTELAHEDGPEPPLEIKEGELRLARNLPHLQAVI